MPPPRTTFEREAITGRIIGIRPAGWEPSILADPDVCRLFAAKDRAWRLAHGGTLEDEADIKRAEVKVRHRLLMRRTR